MPTDTAPVELDVFISYSHRDDAFVGRLKAALAAVGRTAWVDEDDIPRGAPWEKELGSAVEAATAFVFIISPDSVASGSATASSPAPRS